MATNDNALSCSKGSLTFHEMLAACIGVEASGKKYVRTHKVTAVPGSNGISCNSGVNTEEELENELRNVFCLDANGDWAIRMSQTT
jgi:hypothetical protein